MPSYPETIQYLFNLQFSGIKLGLENVTRILEFLGNPQNKWPAIHLAGTNGKGSTAAFIFSILRETGLKVGLYTSPHLVDFSERIRVNDESISWNTIVEYTELLKKEIDKHQATFFEATSAIAFHYFAEKQVDIAVIETGLGGRLDATNLVHPKVTVITPIGYDHQQYLGEDLISIAGEKAGIIKESIPCVTNNTNPEIFKLLKKICASKQAPFHPLIPSQAIQPIEMNLERSAFDLTMPEYSFKNLEIRMPGEHQLENAALAISALLKLKELQMREEMIRDGLKKTEWPGRMQVIRKNPLVILDVAHNPEGFLHVLKFIRKNLPGKHIRTIVGLAKDKDFQTIADILSRYVTELGVVAHFSDRGIDARTLIDALDGRIKNLELFDTVSLAYRKYLSRANSDDIILIIGSHYLAGDFLKKIQIS
ncbi:MAG: bifunctional folylpolyglutamate synthase/dihydrofolate synthase [Calditrichia bacterium]|nr:bifunctional folylpolyglutamate synthase/dihydrofolate synthase [Calditrichia bacterium]